MCETVKTKRKWRRGFTDALSLTHGQSFHSPDCMWETVWPREKGPVAACSKWGTCSELLGAITPQQCCTNSVCSNNVSQAAQLIPNGLQTAHSINNGRNVMGSTRAHGCHLSLMPLNREQTITMICPVGRVAMTKIIINFIFIALFKHSHKVLDRRIHNTKKNPNQHIQKERYK